MPPSKSARRRANKKARQLVELEKTGPVCSSTKGSTNQSERLPDSATRCALELRHPVQWDTEPNGDDVTGLTGCPNPFVAINIGDPQGIWQDYAFVERAGENPLEVCREVLQVDGSQKSLVVPAGLSNMGATCYLNAVVQTLYFNVHFRQNLLQCNSSSELVKSLQEVFAFMSEGRRKKVDPSAVVRALRIDGTTEEDANEFCTNLLDRLERELQDAEKPTFIAALFQGEVAQIMSCMNASAHTFERPQLFCEVRARLPFGSGAAQVSQGKCSKEVGRSGVVIEDTVLDMGDGGMTDKNAAPFAVPSKKNAKKKHTLAPQSAVVRLEELLRQSAFEDESMSGHNKYYCTGCHRKVDAKRSVRLAKAPQYLHVTIERQSYDLHRGQRKLNTPVSFPQHLQLRLLRNSVTTDVKNSSSLVTYDCMGFLEHLSLSEDVAHYTATLFEEEFQNPAAQWAQEDADFGVQCPSGQNEMGNEGDAAAGAPRRGFWWTLDDSNVSLKRWPSGQQHGSSKAAQEAATAQSCLAPARIVSASAYMLIYRRRDCPRTGCTVLPDDWAVRVAADNARLEKACQAYKNQSCITNVINERRLAVNSLVQSLCDAYDTLCVQLEEQRLLAGTHAVNDGTITYPELAKYMAVIPSKWLNSYLHGDDWPIDPSKAFLKPTTVSYDDVLIKRVGKGGGWVLNPFAIWCGQVKLIPNAALEEFCNGNGMDPSLFLKAESVLDTDACEKAFDIARLFVEQCRQIRKILTESPMQVPDMQSMQEQGASRAVWLPFSVQKLLQSMSEMPVTTALLHEAQSARLAGRATTEEAKTGTEAKTAAQYHDVVRITEGLLCPHGLAASSDAGSLVRRADLEYLLLVARKKRSAYTKIWSEAAAAFQGDVFIDKTPSAGFV